jgi:hypothetical protein
MDRSVYDTETAFGAAPVEEMQPSDHASRKLYSPGDFLREFAVVLAVCFSLALLAELLVPILAD